MIGFSQATTIEPWRAQFNKDIMAEAKKHPDVELIITDGEDKTEKQVADVENLIRQEVDALLISPKELAGLTGVVEQAIDAGIPVFVLDRNVDTDSYTQFIGGDNVADRRAPPANMPSSSSAARARPRATSSRSGAAWARSPPRPPRRLPRIHRQGAGHQVPARPAIGRLEAGPGLRHHGDGPAQPTRRSTSSTATTTRWPTAPISRPRTPAARRTSSSSASTRCRRRRDVGEQRRAHRHLPLRHARRRGSAPGAQAS